MAYHDIGTYKQILLGDVPEAYRDLAEDLGMDAFLKLVRLCSGQYLYIPKWGLSLIHISEPTRPY